MAKNSTSTSMAWINCSWKLGIVSDHESSSARATMIMSHSLIEMRLREGGDVDVVHAKEVTELSDFAPDGTSIPIRDAFAVHT